jgi:hypothetical protein
VYPGRYYFEGAAVKGDNKRSDFLGVSPAFTVTD